MHLPDIAKVKDSVEDLRAAGMVNGKLLVVVVIFRQPGANIIETVDRVKDLLPQLRPPCPEGWSSPIVQDRTPPIRGSLRDVERSLDNLFSTGDPGGFRVSENIRSTIIPAVAVAVSLVGTFGVISLFGSNPDNLSLMARTIATGFVVDDAIVVLENITPHRGGGPRREAAFLGAQEIGFTVLSMSTSLVAVFIPILLMGGMVGRLSGNSPYPVGGHPRFLGFTDHDPDDVRGVSGGPGSRRPGRCTRQ